MNLSLKNTYSFLYENELKNIKERDFSHQQPHQYIEDINKIVT